jgi:3-hydroxyisobutyrate dehydrogenase-like beta-hydroxyacid dehydrogenase
MTTIGFIGAGMMGEGMIRCLMSAGHEVSVVAHCNRTRIDDLVADGAREAATRSELARNCEVIITCVSGAFAVQDVADDILPVLGRHQLWIDATTSDPEVTRRIAEDAEAAGFVFADAPVTGGPPMAARGELASLVGCRREKFNRVKAIVGAYWCLVQRFGEPGAGHTAKLLNNFVTQSTGMLLVEAFDRARRAGVDWRALYDVMCVGAARSGTLEKMVGPALEGHFDGSQFSIANARKDLDYYRSLSAAMDGRPSGLANAAFEILDAAVGEGHGQDHVSSLLEPRVTRGAS